MKKEYIKPTIQVVQLESKTQLLFVSGVQNSGLEIEDNILIDNDGVGSGFFARQTESTLLIYMNPLKDDSVTADA